MSDSDSLHPFKVLQIADMSQFVDRMFRNREGLSKHSRRIGDDFRRHNSMLTEYHNVRQPDYEWYVAKSVLKAEEMRSKVLSLNRLTL